VTKFRKICRFLHREIGYFAVGLTVIYCISGVAVNHIDDWNPNYAYGTETYSIEPVPLGETPEVTQAVLSQLDLDVPVVNTWRATPEQLRVILENGTIDVDLLTGEVRHIGYSERPVLLDMNYMHLNHGKGIWTWIADVFAVALFILALSGIFLVRGRKGLAGRGGVWLMLGIALPLTYILFERYF
jgi:hypothetical protein